MKLRPDGFELTFTQPVDLAAANQPENYSLQHYHYHYRPTYGSPQMDVTGVNVLAANLSADARSIRLTVPELRSRKIYELNIRNLRAKDGNELLHPVDYYTLNRLKGG